MSDEDRWQVPAGRRAALAAHNTSVRNGGRDDAVLYYPGSGADIMHALFAAGAKARYFIFVDPLDLHEQMPAHIMERSSVLLPTQTRPILDTLRIRSPAARGWMFSMAGQTRFLLHFRMGHDAFVAANRGFVADIVFEKDFWETEDEVDLSSVLQMLRVGGQYSTNASLGLLAPVLSLVGLDHINTYQINGDQHLFRRRTATRLTWTVLSAAVSESVQVVQEMIVDDDSALSCSGVFDQGAIRDELILRQNDIIEPFLNRGVVLSMPVRRRLCRQIAVKAVGGGAAGYIGGIDGAFG